MKMITIISVFILGLLVMYGDAVEGKEEVTCDSVPQVKSGTLNTGSRTSFREGDYLQHQCNPGFDSVNPVTTYCRNGNWTKSRFGCDKCYGHWTLIFRAMGGIGGETTAVYMNSDTASEKDNSTPDDCSTRSTRGHCRVHYRSSLIDDWGLLKIKKVKIELLKNNDHVAHVVFNGAGTTSTNWFDKTRILSSSYNDDLQHSNVFSMFGHVNHIHVRRWMINRAYDGCTKDFGWIVSVEKSGYCPEEKNRKYPAFLYSPFSHYAKLSQYREADLMAVYIEADGLCNN